MKTLSLRAFALILVLGTQAFAQRFTAKEPDIFITGFNGGGIDTGYISVSHQLAALGEKSSSYANLALVGGRDTVLSLTNRKDICTYNVISSHGKVLGRILPLKSASSFISLSNVTIDDNCALAAVVLDSLSDSKKSAIVLFSAQKRMTLMQISIDNSNNISSSVLKDIDLPESMWKMQQQDNDGKTRRLALVGIAKIGNDKVYNLAFGNPHSSCGAYINCGRIDFFSIYESSWTLHQQNKKGLSIGDDGFFISEGTMFGNDLAVIDNLDKNGGKGLAVLLSSSKSHLKSAIYIFFMDDDWTPNAKFPVIINEDSSPWLEDHEASHKCEGMNLASWKDENPHLLVACRTEKITPAKDYIKRIIIKDIALDSSGNLLNLSTIYSNYSNNSSASTDFWLGGNPIVIKNHKNDLYSILFSIYGPASYSAKGSIAILSIMDADYSKNFSVEAGKSEIIASIDSLFYKSGATGFSAKTLFGLAQCEIQDKNILCYGDEKAIGSWSGIELSSLSGCDPYKACKRKDTIYVYARSQKESPNTALRIPQSMLVPYFGQTSLSDIKSLSYFRNTNLQNTNISWNTAGLKLSTVSGSLEKGLLIVPFSQKEGIDTLVFNLSISASTDNHPIFLHIADTSKISGEKIPASPGSDTIWNTAAKKYIALPPANSEGERYTYDIMQTGLGSYAEIAGDYLHILKVDVAEINLAYTENSEIKLRKIILMPEDKPKPLPPSSDLEDPNLTPIHNINSSSFKAFYSRGGLQIDGISEDLEIRSYNFKGNEIQREKISAKGSIFVKLNQNCPQIVQISTKSKKTYISIFPIDATSRHN